jgi:hypothetical protein
MKWLDSKPYLIIVKAICAVVPAHAFDLSSSSSRSQIKEKGRFRRPVLLGRAHATKRRQMKEEAS